MSAMPSLAGKQVAVLATDGFEQSELQEPKRLLESWGAQVDVIAPGEATSIRGWNKKDWGDSVPVDKRLQQAQAGDYDALVLPGGVINPDNLR
ncbi:protease, partial [Xanthomonas sp. LMG 8993]